MREILFRGKRIDNGEWIEGWYGKNSFGAWPLRDAITPCIDAGNGYLHYEEVIPETVGQYTGLQDKNGNRIFEGDILAFPDTGEDGYEYKEGYDFTNVATVCWNNGRWELDDFGDENSSVMDDMCNWHLTFVEIFPVSEVIGSIHDNPELIGGKKDV